MNQSEPTTPSAASSASTDAEEADSAPADQRAAHFPELEEMTMRLARDLHGLLLKVVARESAAYDAAEAASQPGEPPAPLKLRLNSPALVLGFTRLVRAIRDLTASAATPGGAPARKSSAAPAAPRMSTAAKRRLNGMKDEVRKHVERSIKTNAEPHLVEGLLFDMDERLDDPEVEADFGTQTIGHMVLDLCVELGVKPEMTRWPDEMLRASYIAETGCEPDLPPLPKGGMAKGLPAEERLDKLPNGEIGTPGVPPAIEVPPMEFPYASQQPRTAPAMPPDGGRRARSAGWDAITGGVFRTVIFLRLAETLTRRALRGTLSRDAGEGRVGRLSMFVSSLSRAWRERVARSAG
jgi:hypothetical protein